MTDFHSPVGRLVQGSVNMQHQKDMDTNQPLFENGQPVMGTFFALAFPKVLPNGQANTEFDNFFGTLRAVAAAAWPQLFPQGATGNCTHPGFSWKYQDGDGTNKQGKSVADKAGFAGHHIIKFYTAYPLRCFYEGKFAAHEEIQKPEDVIKRGFWCRVFGEAKSNNATGNQVPGISLYPKLLSLVERGEEIASGPDAEQVFGGTAVGWRPPASASPIPSPGGVPSVNVPAVNVPVVNVPGGSAAPGGTPVVNMPVVNVPAPGGVPAGMPMPGGVPAGMPMPGGMPTPQYAVSPALAAQGITIEALLAKGWTHDALVAQGHATKIG